MKHYHILTGFLTATLLLSGCSGRAKPASADQSAAFSALNQGLSVWDSAESRAININGSIFAEYNKTPSAVQFSGIHQRQPGDNGEEVYSLLTFRYGDDYYYNYYYMSDGARYVAAIEGGSGNGNNNSTDTPVYHAEELDAASFQKFTGYANSVLVFDESQIDAVTTETDKATGLESYHFTLKPDTCADTAISLLEQIQYIDTSAVEITCDVTSMSCDADFQGDILESLTYNLNCDLTAEGEVMNTSFRFSHTLTGTGDDAAFTLPDLDAVLDYNQ